MSSRFFISILATTLLSLLASAAGAQTAPAFIEGNYVYQGAAQLRSQRHFELVQGADEPGRAKVRQMEADGYGCFIRPGNLYLCNKVVPYTEREGLMERVQSRFQGLSVRFYQAYDSTLTGNGQVVKQWNVMQKVLITDPSQSPGTPIYFDHSAYKWINGQNQIFPGGADNFYNESYIETGDNLVIPYETTLHNGNGHFSYDTYWFDITLVKTTLP